MKKRAYQVVLLLIFFFKKKKLSLNFFWLLLVLIIQAKRVRISKVNYLNNYVKKRCFLKIFNFWGSRLKYAFSLERQKKKKLRIEKQIRVLEEKVFKAQNWWVNYLAKKKDVFLEEKDYAFNRRRLLLQNAIDYKEKKLKLIEKQYYCYKQWTQSTIKSCSGSFGSNWSFWKQIGEKEQLCLTTSKFVLDKTAKLIIQLYLRNFHYFFNDYADYDIKTRFFFITTHPNSTYRVRERLEMYAALNLLDDYYVWMCLMIESFKYECESLYLRTDIDAGKLLSENCYWVEKSRFEIARSHVQNLLYGFHRRYLTFSIRWFKSEQKIYKFIFREFLRKNRPGNDYVFLYLQLAYEQDILLRFLETIVTPFSKWDDIHITWTKHKLLLYRRNLHKWVDDNERQPGVSIKKDRNSADELKLTKIANLRIKPAGSNKFQAAVA